MLATLNLMEKMMTTRPWRPLAASIFLVFGASACSGDTTDDSSTGDSGTFTDVSYADVQAIWDGSCAGSGCHTSGGTSGGLALDDGSSHANLVGVAATGASMDQVTAGSTDDSYLWHKLQDTHGDAGGSGSAMPLGGSLTGSESSTVESWILNGAPSD